jgi:hypothetical protein
MLPTASMNFEDQGVYRGTMAPELPGFGKMDSEPYMELLMLGWDTSLPDPQVLHHLYVLTSVLSVHSS